MRNSGLPKWTKAAPRAPHRLTHPAGSRPAPPQTRRTRRLLTATRDPAHHDPKPRSEPRKPHQHHAHDQTRPRPPAATASSGPTHRRRGSRLRLTVGPRPVTWRLVAAQRLIQRPPDPLLGKRFYPTAPLATTAPEGDSRSPSNHVPRATLGDRVSPTRFDHPSAPLAGPCRFVTRVSALLLPSSNALAPYS
jgi:hypothetical protein